MKPYLNQGQYIKLTNSLLNSLQDIIPRNLRFFFIFASYFSLFNLIFTYFN